MEPEADQAARQDMPQFMGGDRDEITRADRGDEEPNLGEHRPMVAELPVDRKLVAPKPPLKGAMGWPCRAEHQDEPAGGGGECDDDRAGCPNEGNEGGRSEGAEALHQSGSNGSERSHCHAPARQDKSDRGSGSQRAFGVPGMLPSNRQRAGWPSARYSR